MTMISPSLEEFRRLAEHGNLVPVVAEIVSDVETPVGAFQKIGRDGFSFLFESAERNEESVGFVGYDVIRFFEPKATIHLRDDLKLPEMLFMIASALLVFDHRFRTMRVI